MDRVKKYLSRRQSYEQIDRIGGVQDTDGTHYEVENDKAEQPFSWLEYSVFLLQGVAMLWAW